MAAFLEPFVFFLTSGLSLALIYYKVSIPALQQIILAVLIILLISFRWLLGQQTKKILKSLGRIILLSLTALFVQILVISSGGFYSPLLILLHLYTLGTSFLLNARASISFLVFSVAVLILNIILDPKLQVIFQDDPGSVVLYVVSFIVIIPLAQTLMKTYHLKDALAKILGESLNLRVMREKSILTSLNEIVVITEPDLKIVSVNDAFEEALGFTDIEVVNQNLLEKLSLFDKDNIRANTESLSVNEVLSDKTNHIISGLYFKSSENSKAKPVIVEVKPILGLDRKIRQLVFVVKDPNVVTEHEPHANLEAAHSKQNLLVTNLKGLLVNLKIPGVQTELELLKEGQNDLLIARDLEDHPITVSNEYEDLVFLCKKAVADENDLAKSLGVSLQLLYPNNDPGESSYLNLRENSPGLVSQVMTDYSIQTNIKWFGILINKLLELMILLGSQKKNSSVELSINSPVKTEINIELKATAPFLTPQQQKELFVQYYGSLSNTTYLRLGSGLEGFIAKVIADQLGITLNTRMWDADRLVIGFKLYRRPRTV